MAILRRAAFSVPRLRSNGRQVPSWPVALDREHALARGLRGLWLPGNSRVDLTGSNGLVTPVTSTITIGNSLFGPALYTSASSYLSIGSQINYPAISIILLMQPMSFSLDYAGYFIRRIGTSALSHTVYTRTTGKLAIYFSAPSTAVGYDNTGQTLTAGTMYHVAATYDVTQGVAGYVNGQLDGTAAPAGVLDPTTASSATWLGADQFNTGARTATSVMPLAAVYDRALSASEVLQHYTEPFAMLQPTVRRGFFLPSAAVVAPSAVRPRITMVA